MIEEEKKRCDVDIVKKKRLKEKKVPYYVYMRHSYKNVIQDFTMKSKFGILDCLVTK